MTIELLYELLMDTAPIYLYLGMLLSIMGTIKLTGFDMPDYIKHAHIRRQNHHAIRIQAAPVKTSIGEATDTMEWLVQKAMRIDAPDDDADDHPFSFFTTTTKKRGGTTCNDHLYSQVLINIV